MLGDVTADCSCADTHNTATFMSEILFNIIVRFVDLIKDEHFTLKLVYI